MLNEMRRRIAPLSIPKRCIAAVIGIAIVLTVIFIFSNSMKPPAESTEDSNAVKDLVAQVIPPESDLGQKIIKNIRKIAHFTEYGLLGIEVSLLLCVLVERKRNLASLGPLSMLFALVVAFLDESIQILSKRGPMIADVWIDLGGFFTYSFLTYFVFLGIRAAVLAIKARRAGK